MRAFSPTALAAGCAIVVVVIVVSSPPVADAARGRRATIDSTALLADTLPTLLGQALASDHAWENLVYLCDRIGHRISGSPQLDVAIAWAVETMTREGLQNVHPEEVMVPRWVRGSESLEMLAPVPRPLPMLGLGGSVGTDGEPIEADVVVVGSFDELAALPDEAIAGRIVLYDVPFTTYGETVQYRGHGPSAAAGRGAVGTLVRSVTPVSLQSPHTGALRYSEDAPRIPAAAITVEDAETIHRLSDRGTMVRVRLLMEARFDDDVPSANVVGEVIGRERPDEIVVVGCHLDSWDVGQGAQDDGAGCVMAMEAGRLIAALPTKPRRTVRVVLYTNEENGLRGGSGYAEAHAEELPLHFAAIEADVGAGEPHGWRVDVRAGADEAALQSNGEAALARLAPLAAALAPIGATQLELSYSGADIGPIVRTGVVGLGLSMDTSGYWPIHHTEADTVDKIDPMALRRDVAAVAMTAFWLAELEAPLVDPGQPVYEPSSD